MTESLIIKDGAGSIKSLEVESGSYGYIPVHTISGSVNVEIAPASGYASPFSVTSASFSWIVDPYDGTTVAATENFLRKGLMIFNPGPYNVYIGIANDLYAGTYNGFLVSDTSSAPDVYSFILYPSGTYIADKTTCVFMHGIYFITGAVNDRVFITETY